MVTRVLDEEDRRIIELLREHGLEEEVRRYEARIGGGWVHDRKSDPLPSPVPGTVSVAKAAEKLGLTCKEVHRHIELGLLDADTDDKTGELAITNTSIARSLDARRRLAIVAKPLPGDFDVQLDPNSLLGRLFAPDDAEEDGGGE